jgi:large subunit ribosomal protein L23
MDLSIYEVIKRSWITSKAYMLNHEFKQLVLEVHLHANKAMIAEALKKLFNVEAKTIRIDTRKGKRRRVGRHAIQSKDRKRAIVTLSKGQSVALGELASGADKVST